MWTNTASGASGTWVGGGFLNSSTPLATPTTPIPPTLPGLNLSYMGTNVQIALNALQAVTDVEVLATPRLLVLANDTATLEVGSSVPIITSSSSGIQANSLIVNNDALHTNPALGGRACLCVPSFVRERLGLSTHDFSNGDGVVIRPEREVDEDSPLGGNSHPSHLLRGKCGHFFQFNLFRSDCGRLQKHDRARGSSEK